MTLRKYLSHEHPLRFAHRGSTILWPENTMMAFQGAVDCGCIYIETDLHVTKDGVIVMFHDDNLERLTNGSGAVKDRYRQDLRKLDAAYYFKPAQGLAPPTKTTPPLRAGGGAAPESSAEEFPLRNKGIRIPSLEEAMTTFPGVMFNLDLKQAGIEQIVADFISSHGFEERVLIASFKDKRVRRCRKLLKNRTASSAGFYEVARSWAASRVGKSLNTAADALQVPVRRGKTTIIDKKLIEAAHAGGIQVHVWTVNDRDEMRRLIELGVDGIVTDRIDLLVSL
ncbi:MAG: glycerophosphodiester phosphodiesterase [Candidatus Aminicenantes bacterium]|nr:glycerophosphodiester phosphodiesterase [Candidatus Aminicenantes bacterium]